MNDVISVVLGGGRGTRLFPLTRYRSKPAVPIAASYRLVDVAVSNCLHADLRRIFVVTQYESESLHRHVANTYKFDNFSSGFVALLAAEQTEGGDDWFRGTADAVRKVMRHLSREPWEHIAILSGDQIYRMDLAAMIRTHIESGAAATVATKAVPAEQTSGFGILKTDADGRIVHFDEKPPAERLPGLESPIPGATSPAYLASMGIYVFGRAALEKALAEPADLDFGRHVIPKMLEKAHVHAFLYDGYWEDVGTIRSFYEANLALAEPQPAFSFHDPRRPMFTHPRFLAPTKILDSRIDRALIADGCYIDRADIQQAVIGIRSRIAAGARIRRSLILGGDGYDLRATFYAPRPPGTLPLLGIGERSIIENAIIDKDARIGRDVKIVNEKKLTEADGPSWCIREGLVIVPKGAIVPDGTVI